MQIINAEQVRNVIRYPQLIESIQSAFSQSFGMPPRQVYSMAENGENQDGFAVLPAWNDEVISVKAFTHLPDNPSKGIDMIHAQVMVFDRPTGRPIALVDGTELTYWRTAAVSGLSVQLLSREDSQTLLLFGTGHLAPQTVAAVMSVRDIQQVIVAGRSQDKIALTINEINRLFPLLNCRGVNDLASDVASADIISCVTASAIPLFNGEWVTPGTHIDLVGNHSPTKRECDSFSIQNSVVYVDSISNVMREAGEILIPLAAGEVDKSIIKGELADLCNQSKKGRISDGDITLFKSVGTALADLAAAHLVVKQYS